MTGPIDQLDEGFRHTGFPDRRQGGISKDSRCFRMAGVSFRDHRISGGDGGREITANDSIKCERKIIRTKDNDRPDRSEHGPNPGRRINHRVSPRVRAGRFCSLAKLIRGPWKFGVLESWRYRQAGFGMRCFNQKLSPSFNFFGIAFQKIGKSTSRPATHLTRNFSGCLDRRVDFFPWAHGKFSGQQFFRRGVDRLEKRRPLTGSPVTVQKNGLS
jgi:hypothetical protein